MVHQPQGWKDSTGGIGREVKRTDLVGPCTNQWREVGFEDNLIKTLKHKVYLL